MFESDPLKRKAKENIAHSMENYSDINYPQDIVAQSFFAIQLS